MTEQDRQPDPLDCRATLAVALVEPALTCFQKSQPPDLAAARAAYVVAVSLGRCRIFGVETIGELEGALPLPVALAAAQEMNLRVCRQLRGGAHTLPVRLNRAIAIEAEDACADLLAGCLDAWAAQVALCEAYRAEPDDTAEARTLAGALEYFAGEMALVDASLRSVAAELTLAASGYLLENWRSCLAPEFAEAAPWWLAGELEELAAEVKDANALPWLDPQTQRTARRGMQEVTDEAQGGFADASEHEPKEAEIEEEEMAIAADGGGSDNWTPAEQRTIQYLTASLPDILGHGDSEVWFAIDSEGSLSAHTYDAAIAGGYASLTGPHRVPLLVDYSRPIEPEVQKLIHWLMNELHLDRDAAEQVCVNNGWRW